MKKRIRTFVAVVQSILIIVMMVLVSSMIYQINCLQGTARVINYAGIVRGATQRAVKLEIVGQRNDDLILYLDEIVNGLKNESGKHKLVKLDDETYQRDIKLQISLKSVKSISRWQTILFMRQKTTPNLLQL